MPFPWNAVLGWGGARPMAEETEEFAELLRELKARSGQSYAGLAKRLHMSTSTVHRYCNGDAVPAEYAPVERFARVCGAKPEELVELHRHWILADAARRRKAATSRGGGGGPGPPPPPAPPGGGGAPPAPPPPKARPRATPPRCRACPRKAPRPRPFRRRLPTRRRGGGGGAPPARAGGPAPPARPGRGGAGGARASWVGRPAAPGGGGAHHQARPPRGRRRGHRRDLGRHGGPRGLPGPWQR
ncbi:helix-turn-helix domain-containing protein [Streptomyces abikoensis]|uniref:helix-turn-helix domain-containing protein n=1 Tax=Streptomyces abikoensis TaxID=97398 RepID=UPI0036A23E20